MTLILKVDHQFILHPCFHGEENVILVIFMILLLSEHEESGANLPAGSVQQTLLHQAHEVLWDPRRAGTWGQTGEDYSDFTSSRHTNYQVHSHIQTLIRTIQGCLGNNYVSIHLSCEGGVKSICILQKNNVSKLL